MDLASSVAHASCLQRVKCNPVAEAADESRSPTWGVSGRTRKREALIPLSERVHGVHGGLSPVRTQRICEYIVSNLDRKIRLETLAEMGGLSVRTLDVALKDLAVGRHTNT